MIIRIWDGCSVRFVLDVDRNGGSAGIGAVGGAGNSTKVDIELDPWAGLIVDNRTQGGPVSWQSYEKDLDEAYERGRAHDE
jgi:hypothetical protein